MRTRSLGVLKFKDSITGVSDSMVIKKKKHLKTSVKI
jgi:hypothetical protein